MTTRVTYFVDYDAIAANGISVTPKLDAFRRITKDFADTYSEAMNPDGANFSHVWCGPLFLKSFYVDAKFPERLPERHEKGYYYRAS